MKKYYIYTLSLEENRIYVGVTSNLTRRYRQHHSGKGANYTRKYKPLGIASYFVVHTENIEEACIYEDARALEMIFSHGIARVRGGRFFSPRTKRSSLRRNYSKIDDKYKKMKQEKSKVLATSLAEMKGPRSRKRRDLKTWDKQVAEAKRALELSTRHLA